MRKENGEEKGDKAKGRFSTYDGLGDESEVAGPARFSEGAGAANP